MKPKEILSKIGLSPHKSKGQNFLLNQEIAKSIVNFSTLPQKAESAVLEIGPGIGALTQEILSYTDKLALIEIEARFCNYLKETYQNLNQDLIYNSSFEKINLKDICKQFNTDKLLVISNVPYSVSSDFFLWLIRNREYIDTASLLFQREFSQRLAASSGGREYGTLSILCETFSDAKLGSIISGKSFYPSAEVESRLIRLKFKQDLDFDIFDFKTFEKVIRAAFSHRRKTIYNSIKLSGLFDDNDELKRCLELAKFNLSSRAEVFNAKDYSRLTQVVFKSLAKYS